MSKRWTRVVRMAAVVLLLPVAVMCLAFGLPAQYGETFLGALAHKVDALQSAPGKRIILTGGSGAAFGVRSDLLEQALPGYAVVNLGMYAGLGSTVTLALAEDALRPGDVVVFLPEQSRQTLSCYLNAEAMWQAADGHWQLLRAVRPEEWGALLGQLPAFAAQKARYWRSGSAPAGEGIYTRSAFNAWGDIDSPLRAQNIMRGGYDPNTPLSFSAELPAADFIERVNGYAARFAEGGAALYFGFCPMNASAVSAQEQARADDYQTALAARLTCPLLGSAQDSLMAAEWFYDTNFHLNSAGAVQYTHHLAALLQQALGVTAALDMALPEMPELAGADAFQGNDADADCFGYTATADGLLATSLTAAGRARTRLVVSTQYDGQPVVGFSATLFAGNTTIEEIVLQPNITAITDGSFAGCTALQRLRMESGAPSACAVGEGLLTGTSAAVYVPLDSIGAYKTNYFWSVHASRIRSDDAAETTAVPAPPTEPIPAAGRTIRYDANGGRFLSGETVLAVTRADKHLRLNTHPGNDLLRPGYALLGWNTMADGSGAAVGLGSRVDRADGQTLYAQWLPETPASAFQWTEADGQVWITGYSGTEAVCVIPSVLDHLPVRRICEGAFSQSGMETLVLPSTLYAADEGAFAEPALREVYLCDSLRHVSDAAFGGAPALQTLHIQAATAPAYSTSYYATFADKIDWLRSLGGQRKLVLFSGSSTRYGYDSAALHAAFPAYQVANMGVYAYTNALPQLELIRALLSPGDVLLHAPELDTLHNQFCEEKTLDAHFFAMAEANYDLVAALDLREFTAVFDCLNTYLVTRMGMPRMSYDASPNGYDDDGIYHAADTYNAYGDFILRRSGGTKDELLQHTRANYTTASFPRSRLDAINAEYARFLGDGVTVLFTYTPRNRSSLTPESTPAARAALDALLRKELAVPVISGIEDSFFSGTYFYLIDSHLSTEGVALRNERLIEDLTPWLTAAP